jgi:cell division protein FtsW
VKIFGGWCNNGRESKMGRKLSFDRVLFLTILSMLLFGVLMVYSASSIWALEHKGSSYYYLNRQVMWALLGVAIMALTMSTDYRQYRRRPVVLGMLAVTGLLLVWALLSPAVNGAHRWIFLGPLSFQPSEVAKLAMVVILAYHLSSSRKTPAQSLVPALLMVGPMILLVFLQKDLGTAVTMGLLLGALYFLAGLRVKTLATLALIAMVVVAGLVLSEEYRIQRVLTYFSENPDLQGSGFQLHQSKLAVATGGITGQSLGESRQKMLFLPLPHTDFIFAVIGEELGMVGCLAVLAGFLVILWRGLRMAMRIQDPFGTYLCLGLTLLLVVQGMINIGVVLGLLPTKGLALPLISYGGSSLVASLASAGVLLNLSQFSD